MSKLDMTMTEPEAQIAAVPAKRTWIRPIFLVGLMVFIIIQIVVLSPSSLEKAPSRAPISAESLIEGNKGSLAKGIPTHKVPDYSINKFHYVSTQAGVKQWKLVSEKAFLYNAEKIVHARTVTAYLFDKDDKITVVTGNEAKYFMNERDLEIFGSVVTRFPDGFETQSEYMRYLPASRKVVIPPEYKVTGGGKEDKGQRINFESLGLDFPMDTGQITLNRNVTFTMTPSNPSEGQQRTTIDSDRCVIERDKQIAHFTMNPSTPLLRRFVHIKQPTLYAQSRSADLRYGDYSQVLQYLSATQDVLIKETGKKTSLRYATGGRADFDSQRNLVVLKDFPQAYQDNDTVTGDVIILHRDTDIVEVENSNGFSEGQANPTPQ